MQELVNAYLALGQRMDEVLCMYYTIEMLDMLEVLHRVGLIHGDLKPDNLLIRSDRCV
jgi:checkpoint serine/threonine-protein kinase